MSNVWEYILLKSGYCKTLTKKHNFFFGFILKVSTFQTFYLKSKIETSDRLFHYSHYCLESLRLSALETPSVAGAVLQTHRDSFIDSVIHPL